MLDTDGNKVFLNACLEQTLYCFFIFVDLFMIPRHGYSVFCLCSVILSTLCLTFHFRVFVMG